jgi:hypothetical protein
LNGTCHLLLCAVGVNLLGENLIVVKNKIYALLEASWNVGLGLGAEITKYTLTSHHQNAAQNCNLKTVGRVFENVAEFKYLGTTVTYQTAFTKRLREA